MKPANDPTIDYRALVLRGYDLCADTYQESRRNDAGPELELLTSRLGDGADVLDLGCGPGVPNCQTLAQRFNVTGVDASGEMIRLARSNVLDGTFIRTDMMSVDFPGSSFDAVIAFYSIFHLPKEEHPELFRRIYKWLRPGGYLLCTLTRSNQEPYTEDDFFGVTMYWSNYGLEDYQRILTGTGFILLDTSEVGHGYTAEDEGSAEHHPLVFAHKPSA